MKKEITIPEQLHKLKPEELEAAAKRRENYSITRDIQAKEFNNAILMRLAREKELERERENTEISRAEIEKQIKCAKCGMELSVEITMKGTMECPECSNKIKIL